MENANEEWLSPARYWLLRDELSLVFWLEEDGVFGLRLEGDKMRMKMKGELLRGREKRERGRRNMEKV